MTVRTLLPLLALSLLLVAAGRGDRYGMEGRILGYDPETDLVTVEVTRTGVSGRFGTGGTAGGEPPDSIEEGAEIEMAVVPEGSVLKRTVVKAMTGGGLDNTGTREGFQKALAAIPEDRPVVISFEANRSAPPEWVVRMVQIRLTPEEVQQRIEAMTSDP